jgi:hypothetical protein
MYLEFLCGLCLSRCAVMVRVVFWTLRIARGFHCVIIIIIFFFFVSVFFFQLCVERPWYCIQCNLLSMESLG